MDTRVLARPPRPEALRALAEGAVGKVREVARGAAEAIAAAEGFSLDDFRVFFAGSREVALSHLIISVVRTFAARVNRRPRVVTVACAPAVETYCNILRGEKAAVWESPALRGDGTPDFPGILAMHNVALAVVPALPRSGVVPAYRAAAPQFEAKGVPLCLDLGECTGAGRPPANPGRVAALVGGFSAAGGVAGVGFYAVRHEVLAGFNLRPATMLGAANLAGLAATRAALTAAAATRDADCAGAAKNAEAAAIYLKTHARTFELAQLGTPATLAIPRPCIAVLAINGRGVAAAARRGTVFEPNLAPTGPPPAPGALALVVLGRWETPEDFPVRLELLPRNKWRQTVNKFEAAAVRGVLFPPDAKLAARMIQALVEALKPVSAAGAPTRGREEAPRGPADPRSRRRPASGSRASGSRASESRASKSRARSKSAKARSKSRPKAAK